MKYTDTRLIEVASPADLRRLFRALLRLLVIGPRSVRLLLAVQVERDVSFIRRGKGATVIDFKSWVSRQFEEVADGDEG